MRMQRAAAIAVVIAVSACGTLLGQGDDETELPPRAEPDAARAPDAPSDPRDVDADADDAASDAPVEAARKRLVFVTGSRYAGALGGGAGADAKCQAAATAAGLAGTFVAYLATDGGTAESRLGGAAMWFRTNDGARVFDAGPAFEATPAVPIDRTEDGGVVGSPVFVWTGNAPANAGERTCSDWTATTGFGGFGKADTNGAEWKQGTGTVDCATTYRLYCFEL